MLQDVPNRGVSHAERARFVALHRTGCRAVPGPDLIYFSMQAESTRMSEAPLLWGRKRAAFFARFRSGPAVGGFECLWAGTAGGE